MKRPTTKGGHNGHKGESQPGRTINVAIAGLGNCASSLVQGAAYYASLDPAQPQTHHGMTDYEIGGYLPADITFVAAFDIDDRKVGKPITEAIFSPPNCTTRFCHSIKAHPGIVHMGKILDGIAPHTLKHEKSRRIIPSRRPHADAARILKDTRAHILLCYTPVGAEKAASFYAQAALDARVALINCVPAFIASTPSWEDAFKRRRTPIIGDDIKSQLGATIVHRTLVRLFESRGITVDRTYQLNVGGNTDFLNMLSMDRLASKKISKTESVQSQMRSPLPTDSIHIGPSDYIPFLNDNKVCFIRIEGRGFGNMPLHIEARLSVEDSPNSAGIVIDAIRCARLALDAGIGGALEGPSAYFMKHPPRQHPDEHARQLTADFIKQASSKNHHKRQDNVHPQKEESSLYMHLRNNE